MEDLERLVRILRAKTRQAYKLADELRRIGAQLEAEVDNLKERGTPQNGSKEALTDHADIRA